MKWELPHQPPLALYNGGMDNADSSERDHAAVVRETVALYNGGMDNADSSERDHAAVVRERWSCRRTALGQSEIVNSGSTHSPLSY